MKFSIREAETKDGEAVSEIWIKGLPQTVDNSWWIFRALLRSLFDKAVEHATGPDGDLGPKGSNLVKNWIELGPDRNFYVAVDDETQEVVGCVGVKKKGESRDHLTVVEDSTISTIERLSVKESAQRRGIAATLLQTAEKWAVDNGCEKMSLNSANPIAKQFYLKQGYVDTESWTGFLFTKMLKE